MKGGCLVVFPAGGVSTTPTIWHKRAIDTEWKNFTARLISQAKAPVAPVYFAGQNSRLFQLASHISMTLAPLAAVQGSARPDRQRNSDLRIGELVPYERLAGHQRPPVRHGCAERDHLFARRRRAREACKSRASSVRAARRARRSLHERAHPRVGLFVTCLVDLVRPQVGFAAVKLLEQAGCDVEVPPSADLLRPAGLECRRGQGCRATSRAT